MNSSDNFDVSELHQGESYSAPMNPFTNSQAADPEGQLDRDGAGQPLKPVTVQLTKEHLRLAEEIALSRFYHPAQDGGETPEWFVKCSVCQGSGCGECWNTGRVSPHLDQALFHEQDDASECWDAFRHLLFEEKLHTQGGHEAFVALGQFSLQYLTAWGYIEQPNMPFDEGAPDGSDSHELLRAHINRELIRQFAGGAPKWPDDDEILKADIRRDLKALEQSLDCHRRNAAKFRSQFLQAKEEIRRLRGDPEESVGSRPVREPGQAPGA